MSDFGEPLESDRAFLRRTFVEEEMEIRRRNNDAAKHAEQRSVEREEAMPEITINLDELYGGEQPFPDALITEAARLALRTWTAPGPEGQRSEVPTALARRIEETVTEIIREEAAAAAPKVVEEILAEGVQRTNQYGSPRGEKMPLRDVIGEEVVKQLTRRERHGMGDRTVIEEMLEREVEKVVKGELRSALDEATKTIVDAVGEEASKGLTDALRKALPGIRV